MRAATNTRHVEERLSSRERRGVAGRAIYRLPSPSDVNNNGDENVIWSLEI